MPDGMNPYEQTDWATDFTWAMRAEFGVVSPNTHAIIKNVTNEPPRPLIYRYRYWPRWLCWLFGHEPVVPIDDPSRDHERCFCGAHEVGGLWRYMPDGRRRNHWWPRLVARVWRWLP